MTYLKRVQIYCQGDGISYDIKEWAKKQSIIEILENLLKKIKSEYEQNIQN